MKTKSSNMHHDIMSDNNLLGQDHDVFTFHVASLLQVCCPDILRQRLYNPTRSPSSTETGTEASLALLPPPGTCGVSNGDRIFGGELTALDEHPWLALIGYIRRECPRIPTRWSHILTVLVFECLSYLRPAITTMQASAWLLSPLVGSDYRHSPRWSAHAYDTPLQSSFDWEGIADPCVFGTSTV